MVSIAAVASGFPPHYYRQEALSDLLRRHWSRRHTNLERLDRFHHNLTVKGRYLALPLEAYETPSSFQCRNNAWIEVALELGESILCKLLDKARIDPQEIAQIVFTTITGIATPSLEARLMNRIPFSSHLKRMPLFGLGCLGGAAGIARAADYLEGHPDEVALLLSVELCSLTIQYEDVSVANMIASGLFGDGAAAVLLAGRNHWLAEPGQPRVVASRAVFFPETEHIMGWDVRDSGFKIVLSADVATIAETHLRPALAAFLGEYGLTLADIDHWIAHPGGPKVMDALESGLELDNDALQLSRESLAEVGNISSTSVLLILEETLKQRRPAPGSYGLLMAMGPAFCAELVLLQW